MPGIPIKWILIGLAVIAVVTAIGLGYNHYNNLVEANATLRENVTKLEASVLVQKQTIAAAEANAQEWKLAFEDWQSTLSELVDVNQQATQELTRLGTLFAKHDVERIALAKPVLVEHRINSGTADALRMFERATSGNQDRARAAPPATRAGGGSGPVPGAPVAGAVEGGDAGDAPTGR